MFVAQYAYYNALNKGSKDRQNVSALTCGDDQSSISLSFQIYYDILFHTIMFCDG